MKLRGDVNSLTRLLITGWALDASNADRHVKLVVAADPFPPQTVTADVMRPDLAAKGIGGGDHGFAFEIPAAWRETPPNAIRISFAETGELLKRGDQEFPKISAFAVTDSAEAFENAATLPPAAPIDLAAPILLNAAYALSVRVRGASPSLLVTLRFPVAPRLPDFRLQIAGARPGDRSVRLALLREEEGSALYTVQFRLTADGAPEDPVNVPFQLRLGRAAGEEEADGPTSGPVEVGASVLLRQIAPAIVNDFSMGRIAGHQASFTSDHAAATSGDESPDEDATSARASRTLRIAALARPSLIDAFGRFADVAPIDLGVEPLVWTKRFDLALVQSSHVDDLLLKSGSVRFADVAAFLDACEELSIPVVLYADQPDLPEDVVQALQERTSGTLVEEGHGPGAMPSASDERRPTPPCIDTRLFNPFSRRSSAGAKRMGGDGGCLVDGWWALAEALQTKAQAQALEPLLPRTAIIDSRYDVSILRVQSSETLRWNMAGTTTEAQKAEWLRRVSFLVLPESELCRDAGRPRRMLEAQACGSLPVVLDPDASSVALPAASLTVSAVERMPKIERDALLHGATVDALRAGSAAPALRKLAAQLLPRRRLAFDDRPKVSVVAASRRPWQIRNILENFKRQTYANKEHVIVFHGVVDSTLQASLEEAVAAQPGARIFFLPARLTLGDCIDYGARQAEGAFVAKFDDDDFYDSAYLQDAMTLVSASGARIYTQPAGLVYLEASGALIREEVAVSRCFGVFDAQNYRGFPGAGGAMIVAADVFDRVKFCTGRRGGVDTDFAERAIAAGEQLHCGSYFNYVLVRRASKAEHTWQIEDGFFLQTGEVVAEGDLGECVATLNGLRARVSPDRVRPPEAADDRAS